ncbi:Carbohydrate family 9 binding domain-like [Flagellimonas taeanensis]|uniref:Carbohydrate family 9 binding domain-like n=1 Tax=Flagellimonas taeanensis TaxID=1005926 RepID=A0A1M6TDW0_9FLAO|nr:Carbohydrate family 9 binding domain-like [Allomuricauda taeanensis]SHK55054.1 Carbohydrate family 9 binding domain-like [Allomuricauda taeanensis]
MVFRVINQSKNEQVKNALLFILLLTSIVELKAQDTTNVVPKKIYVTKGLGSETPPTIDGLLDDPAWNLVEWGDDFIEQRPDENTPPGQQTAFKIVYGEKSLYIGIRCFDTEPDKIVKRLSRRDGFEGDWIGVFIDSYHDQRTAFGFIVTAAGVKGDVFESNNGANEDDSWNPIWYVKTHTDSEGWTAEMRIPLSQIKFGNEEDQVWGLQFMRRYFRNEERSVWQRLPRDVAGFVSEFGELHGLKNIQPQKQLEIQPYTVARMETYEAEEGNPFKDGKDSDITGGLDAKIGITNDLTLDLTVNPDFGQVDADPSAIALDGFQIFFQERRPFFVENKNIFDFSVSQSEAGNTFGSDNVFYSRRIGRSPQGYPSTMDGEFVDQPDNTPIIGAAKFSGKTKNGWAIGVLESVTARRQATIVDENGNRREETVEPLTNYFVGRLQKDFNNRNSYVGGIFTSTNREDLPQELDFLHQSAYTGALDFKHQWNNRDWYVEGDIILSHVAGSEQAIQDTQRSIAHLFHRVDADHVSVDTTRTSLTGSGGNVQIGKLGKGHWRFESGGTWRSPELELNDIGFQRQADDIRHYTWVGYQTLKPDSTFRQVGINYNHWTAWDFGGNHNYMQFNTNSWQNWKNNWQTNLGLNYAVVDYSNFALRGGPRLRQTPWFSFWNSINTDNRKKIRFSIFHEGRKAVDNSVKSYYIEGGFVYQPINALRISAFPSLGINHDKLQFIDNFDDIGGSPRYLNGEIDQRTLSMSIRLNYTINPNLTIQYWGQPFISRGRYSNFKHVTDATAKRFEDRFVQYGVNQTTLSDGVYAIDEDLDNVADFSFDNPDFSFVQFRSNLVVRWEYIPGSEIFLVWSQDVSRSGDPTDGLLPSLGDNIFGQKPQNIFLLKATYRFVL